MNSTATGSIEAKKGGGFLRIDAGSVALLLLLVATTVIRFNISPYRPLWLDEVQTGMIVTQPTLADFIRECRYDINGPLYYVLALVWAHIAGVSNQALRLLPEFFGTAAPLVALTGGKLVDRPTRLLWCALLACWIPGIWYSQEARPYSLALLLAVANTLVFARLIKAPTIGNAWSWTIVSSFLILAHYFGAILVGCQGLAFLAVHKRRALATWPAALPFLLPASSMAVHASGLVRFTTPGTGWIAPERHALDVWPFIEFIFGGPILIAITLIWLAVLVLAWIVTRKTASSGPKAETNRLWLAAGCAVAAVVLAITLGFVRPFLMPRYLTVFVPGVFLGVALCASRLAPRWRLAGAPLVALIAIVTFSWSERSHFMDEPFSWEFASSWIMRAHPSRLVFFWDTPMGYDSTSQAGLGSFFFRRAGRPVTMVEANIAGAEDPNMALVESAAAPGSAILWIYDLSVVGTAAIRFPPRITKLDPTFACRNFGVRQFGIIACARGLSPKGL